MKWNAFDSVSPAIAKTKKRLFPFNFKEWFKLSVIAALAGNGFGKSGFNGGGNSGNIPDSQNLDIGSFIRDSIKKYWVVGGIFLLIFFILGTFLSYISNVFQFIFIESILEKKAKFTFRKNNSKGVSLFFFRFFFTVLSLIIFVALAFPYIYNFMKGNPIIASVGIPYIIFSITLAIVYFILIWFLLLFVDDFVVPYMYSKKVSAIFAWKQTWIEVRNNKKETFVYWLARLLLGIATGIVLLLILFSLAIAFFIVGLLIFLLGWLIYKFIGGIIILMILGAIILITLILFFILLVMLISLPLGVFMRYFSLFNFQNLTKIKLLK
jgi:hypothetical protein